jgi:hypothetical protein
MGKAKRLDREAVEWARPYLGRATRAALKAGAVQLADLGGRRRKAPAVKSKRPPPTIAGHIRCAAAQSGLSVNEIAARTGTDQSGLNRFLNGTRETIRIDIADRLLRFFGLAISPPKSSRSRIP